jgi:hypothetical protein
MSVAQKGLGNIGLIQIVCASHFIDPDTPSGELRVSQKNCSSLSAKTDALRNCKNIIIRDWLHNVTVQTVKDKCKSALADNQRRDGETNCLVDE